MMNISSYAIYLCYNLKKKKISKCEAQMTINYSKIITNRLSFKKSLNVILFFIVNFYLRIERKKFCLLFFCNTEKNKITYQNK